MNEVETIIAEIVAERVAICMESGISEKQAELTAWIQVAEYKVKQKEKANG